MRRCWERLSPGRSHDRHGTCASCNKLPEPWDLPVIFAVRISMSLPALFQAIRMYRIRRPAPVHDDFGRKLIDQGQAADPPQPDWIRAGTVVLRRRHHLELPGALLRQRPAALADRLAQPRRSIPTAHLTKTSGFRRTGTI